jgi:hypothetical protein
MSNVYPCIGGPLDGKARGEPSGIDHFSVAGSHALRGHYSDPGKIDVTASVVVHRYRLCEVPGVGLAWVHQP